MVHEANLRSCSAVETTSRTLFSKFSPNCWYFRIPHLGNFLPPRYSARTDILWLAQMLSELREVVQLSLCHNMNVFRVRFASVGLVSKNFVREIEPKNLGFEISP